jgi:hypothetical protein
MKIDQTNLKVPQDQQTLPNLKPNLDSSAIEPLLSKLGFD